MASPFFRIESTLIHGLTWLVIALASPQVFAADSPGPRASRVIRVGPDQAITTVAAAARVARNGDVVEIEAGEFHGDVASWPQDDLTIRAVRGRARMVAGDASAEGKAIWVIKGTRVVIENIEFAGMRVPDHNGAGIRHEGGKLTIRNCLFERNEMGLLTWNDPGAELVVEGSEFRDNAVARDYRRGDSVGHQIYVGAIRRFTLRDSYVHRGAFGHLVKTRARENYILNNRITDEESGRASYELEFPNGGIAYVIGNIVQQSAQTENAHLISFGAEGYRGPRNEIYLINNTLVDDLAQGGDFLRVQPGARRVVLTNNLLLGDASLHLERQWVARANRVARRGDVASAASGDYRLRASSALVGTAVAPGTANGVSLRLAREYDYPLHSRPLAASPHNPGALQSVAP